MIPPGTQLDDGDEPYQRHSDKTSPKTLKIREFIDWHGSYFFAVPKLQYFADPFTS